MPKILRKFTHLSYTNNATSHAARDSLSESRFLTLASGISRKTRNFWLPCQRKTHFFYCKCNNYGKIHFIMSVTRQGTPKYLFFFPRLNCLKEYSSGRHYSVCCNIHLVDIPDIHVRYPLIEWQYTLREDILMLLTDVKSRINH